MAYGAILGISVGQHFASRQALYDAGVHRMTQAGIAGYGTGGAAESIVLSDGYADDEDHGAVVIYTGEGGRDATTGRQVADQEATRGNLGLIRAADQGVAIRVSRRSPAGGYTYDGLYTIESYWRDLGRDGFAIYRFKLVQAEMSEVAVSAPAGGAIGEVPAGNPRPSTSTATVVRRIRETAVSRHVKEVHGFRCQVCGVTLEVPGGRYAEAAHIRALGKPHFGPDTPDNLICLCPNDHTLFDRGAIWIDEEWRVQPLGTPLRDHQLNEIHVAHVRYHRETRAQP
jgi:putative restriction endonuclease